MLNKKIVALRIHDLSGIINMQQDTWAELLVQFGP